MPCNDAALDALRERVKWRCRRGLLELDILLARFLARDLDRLDAPKLNALLELLATDDIVLWGWASGREPCPVESWQDWIAALQHP